MASPYLGEIRLFTGNFAPKGWAFCNGQLMAISQATALFSLLGTTYGGDGKTTFALPNYQDRVPVNQGQAPGLSPYVTGQAAGSATAILNTPQQLPMHLHPTGASAAEATTGAPGPGVSLAVASGPIYAAATNLTPMVSQPVGGGLPHSNVQPYLGLNFIIALQGIFPSRN
jgi:microcystin-dependent protein